MLSFGILCARAAWMGLRRRGLPFGSPPPLFAAMVISFDNLLKILPRFASIAPLKRLTFDHLLCPAIGVRSYLNLKTCEQCSPRERNDLRGEKFTAPINRTKTYFVNRRSRVRGRQPCGRVATDSKFNERRYRHPYRRGQSGLKQLRIVGVSRECVRARAVAHLKHNHQAAMQRDSFRFYPLLHARLRFSPPYSGESAKSR